MSCDSSLLKLPGTILLTIFQLYLDIIDFLRFEIALINSKLRRHYGVITDNRSFNPGDDIFCNTDIHLFKYINFIPGKYLNVLSSNQVDWLINRQIFSNSLRFYNFISTHDILRIFYKNPVSLYKLCLENININDDYFAITLSNYIKQLESLFLINCDMSERSIILLLKASNENLKHLNLSEGGTNDSILQYVCDYNKNLITLDLSSNRNVTDVGIISLSNCSK